MPDRQARNFKIKRWLNFSVWFLLIAGFTIIFGEESWWPSYYTPRFFSVMFFLSAIAIVLPEYIFKTDDECKREAVLFLRSAIAFGLIGNCLGELYLYQLYKLGIPYDKLLHFAVSFFLVAALASFWQIWRKASFKQALIMAVLLVLAGGVFWEFIEFSADFLFKTSEFGLYGQNQFWDTMGDLFSDAAGAGLSSIILLAPNFRKKALNEYCQNSTLNLARAKARFKATNQGI